MAIQQSALCGAGLVYATCRYMPLPELDHALPYLSPSNFFGVKGLLLHPRGFETAPELIALLCSASRLAARLGATCDHVSSVIVTSQQTAPRSPATRTLVRPVLRLCRSQPCFCRQTTHRPNYHWTLRHRLRLRWYRRPSSGTIVRFHSIQKKAVPESIVVSCAQPQVGIDCVRVCALQTNLLSASAVHTPSVPSSWPSSTTRLSQPST